MGPRGRFTHVIDVRTGYVFQVELLVQRRLCPNFVSRVGLPDIHKYSGVDGLSMDPREWGVTQTLSLAYIRLRAREIKKKKLKLKAITRIKWEKIKNKCKQGTS